MKLSISCLFLVSTAVRSVVGQLPDQVLTDLNNYLGITRELRSNFVNLPVDLDTKSQVSAITNGLDRLAQIIDTVQMIAGNTTDMVSALVTKTYFCQSFGGYIDATMVPAKETIYWALNSIGKTIPDPLKAELVALTTSLTNSYYKALVYRNYYHNFDRPCIPWGTWSS
ncbi:hypothetical protein BDZ94DRAFT_967535 [Collybia nuda]|uniref:Uncharacterized protein n=1 Tax=Collybia nuda TaxID=64659 RepID=A0A9P5YH76_9AGAR|nr:hypothetical protein BDZ94DRAFT_967535 [Collybia nuda]